MERHGGRMNSGRRARARGNERRGRLAWLIPAIVPIGAAIWFATRDEETRRGLIERVPEGVGGRALEAGLGFCVLVGLAWIVLPITYHGHRLSKRGLAWCLARPTGQRILLLPAMVLLGLSTGLFGLLFAADALAVILTFLGTLCLGVWIVEPTLFGGREALLALFGG